MSYRRILIGEVLAGRRSPEPVTTSSRVTAVDVAQDAVCLHGHHLVGRDFNPLLGSFTDVHAATVIRVGQAGQ